MKKILFIATVESHILYFHLPFLKYFQDKGFEVHVATKLAERKNELIERNVICHDIDFKRSLLTLNNFTAFKQLVKLMKENKFSLVHTHTPVGSFIARLAAKATNTSPILYTAHGFHFYKGAPLKYWLMYYTAEKLAARLTDGLLVMNQEDYEAAQKFKVRKKRTPFYVHGVGLDIEKYKNSSIDEVKKLRKDLKIEESDIVMLSIAELIPRKNYMQVIKALETIPKDINLRYLIVGNGEQSDELKQYVKLKRLEDKIKFLGYRSDVPNILALSDFLILTSKHEGLTKCLMEAMAAGKPIIASNVRGNKELIVDGINGYIVPLDDIEKTREAIIKLACEKDTRISMGLQGQKLILDYSLDKVLEEMDEIYTEFLD